MATKPGPLTEWPWQNLGTFKYLLLSPLALNAIRGDIVSTMLLLLTATRYLHNQLWITISRYYNAKGRNIIQSKSIHFNQIDREASWDEQILFHTLVLWLLKPVLYGSSRVPMWDTKGIYIMAISHAGPAEFVYYWAHRALHHHSLYTMYHSHHHSSFVTEPITSVVHPFAEHIAYFVIFAIAPLASYLMGTLSQLGLLLYYTWFDFVNNMGHCNFEFMPPWTFEIFPPLKYLIYTPSYHSLHHSQVHTNFSLFMPLYDHLYGTVDKSTDALFMSSSKGNEERVDSVYLTHFTDMMSIFHLRLGISSIAGKPYFLKWNMWLLSPFALVAKIMFSLFGETFVCERNRFEGFEMQTWVIPKYISQYKTPSQKASIKEVIKQSIVDAEKSGVKVIGLGLLNKDNLEVEEVTLKTLHKVKIVDGTTLATGWVINSIPAHEKQVLVLCDTPTSLEFGVVRILCERGFKVQLMCDSYDKAMQSIPIEFQSNLTQLNSLKMADPMCKTWIVGREIGWREQEKAQKGTRFVPMMALPITRMRKDCFYESTPAMKVPNHFENLHSCENWLPRGAMSVWRVGGIIHGLEGWSHHEWNIDIDYDLVSHVWKAALKHGFVPHHYQPFHPPLER